MSRLKEKDIHLLFCRITHATDKMMQEFVRHYNDDVTFELMWKDVFGNCEVCERRHSYPLLKGMCI